MKALADYKFIDIHYHASPDLYNRRLNVMEAGFCYQQMNGAVVVKSHLGATAVQATLAQNQGLPVLPSLVLNHIAGGIDYRVILRALAEYQPHVAARMLVHFPTITGRKFKSKLIRQLSHDYLSPHTMANETLFNESGRLKREVMDILKMTRDYPIVLSSGHASKEEVYSLIEACIKENVRALLLNQPANPLTGLTANTLKELTIHDFIWVEQTALTYLIGHQTKEDFIEVLNNVPRVIYSSDLGQTNQMDIAAWRHYSDRLFHDFHLSPMRKEELWRTNALSLLTF
ncbi:DUF6282 family protein [Legionella fairfieldensis]|uniref:DUF6282 family protein n=1 Tax=Legionella fairfieldensis TaxID=45064 RepID=UPI00048F4059|nr:DUF6282 family protein [Legionella fairfieldensis]